MRLVSELRRRNVLRMVALYVIAAWLIMQVTEVLVTLIGLPLWSGRAVLAMLAVGFPISLLLSWFYELTPEGVKLEKDIVPADSNTYVTGRRLDFVAISLLAAAVLLFAYDKWWPAVPTDKSIAVLSFENMSANPDDEYFSDGISEELLNLLTRIPELRVISRTSAFSFKGKDVTIPKLAEQLNVTHVLEGSVRKDGDRVRITVQLIEARSDSHLWSETYDRNLNDIFAVQDEIAAAVVEKLKVTMLGDVLRTQQTDPEVYALLLQARYVGRQGTKDSLIQAEELYKKALAIDPAYSPAWNGLGSVYIDQIRANLLPAENGWILAEEAIGKALELNPSLATAHDGLSWLAIKRDGDLSMAARHMQRALILDPNNSSILGNSANILHELGRLDEATVVMEYAITRDPIVPVGHFNLGLLHLHNKKSVQAKASLVRALTLSPDYFGSYYYLGLVELVVGNAETSLEKFGQEPDDQWRVKGHALAYYALGRDEDADTALAELINKWGEQWPSEIAHVYSFRGELDNAFKWLARESQGGWGTAKHDPLFDSLRVDPRWQEFLETKGVSDMQLAEIEFHVALPD